MLEIYIDNGAGGYLPLEGNYFPFHIDTLDPDQEVVYKAYLTYDDSGFYYTDVVVGSVIAGCVTSPYGLTPFGETPYGVGTCPTTVQAIPIKLYAGSETPISRQWASVGWGNTIELPDMGSQYSPSINTRNWFHIMFDRNRDWEVGNQLCAKVIHRALKVEI